MASRPPTSSSSRSSADASPISCAGTPTACGLSTSTTCNSTLGCLGQGTCGGTPTPCSSIVTSFAGVLSRGVRGSRASRNVRARLPRAARAGAARRTARKRLAAASTLGALGLRSIAALSPPNATRNPVVTRADSPARFALHQSRRGRRVTAASQRSREERSSRASSPRSTSPYPRILSRWLGPLFVDVSCAKVRYGGIDQVRWAKHSSQVPSPFH